MVDEQLAARGVTDASVLAAMRKVPRHEFVPVEVRRHAHADRALPLEHGQSISQPFMVATMTELARIARADRVLEIGTGSGYQTAVLAELAREVYTTEIVPELAREARARLARSGYRNIHFRIGDGRAGWPEAAPFDAIVVTAAPARVPAALVDQLADRGRLVIPVGTNAQELRVLTRNGSLVRERTIFPVRFVPLVDRDPGG